MIDKSWSTYPISCTIDTQETETVYKNFSGDPAYINKFIIDRVSEQLLNPTGVNTVRFMLNPTFDRNVQPDVIHEFVHRVSSSVTLDSTTKTATSPEVSTTYTITSSNK